MSNGLQRVIAEVTGTQPLPTATGVVLAAVLALTAVAVPGVWRYGRQAVTIAHEGAHGVVAALSGRRLAGIRLHRDGSGLTVSHGRPAGIGMVLTAAAGYLGPSVLGLGAAGLLHLGHALAVLWLAVLLLALLLVQIRNLHGLVAVVILGAGVLAVSWWGGAGLQSTLAYAGTWFLLLAAPRTVVELQQLRRRGRAPTSDADVLARLTHVPGLVWVAVFLVVDVAALLAGAWLMLDR